ncbi:CRISPR-associated endonuclease Cas1 [bacterium HR28]|nr:CRISPR-associated endonuclease Cas1 [bacterium HR28]
MKPVYVFSSGRLSRHQNTIVLETDEGKRFLPIEQVSELYIFGEVDLNKRFLEFVAREGILLHFFNRYGYYTGTFYPREYLSSGALLLRQVEHYLDSTRRLTLARAFVRGALRNIRTVMLYYRRRNVDTQDALDIVERALVDLEQADSPAALMAVEGHAREAYYAVWPSIIDAEFPFGPRTRRPPRDETNALISFGNSLLYTAVLAQIYQTHLDPRIGYLHETNFRRHTLNLDVAEVFKPVLVDRLIFRLVNRGQLQRRHFVTGAEGVFLDDDGRKLVVEAWEQTLQETYRHPVLNRSVSYRTTLRLELYKIEKHLLGEQSYVPFALRG